MVSPDDAWEAVTAMIVRWQRDGTWLVISGHVNGVGVWECDAHHITSAAVTERSMALSCGPVALYCDDDIVEGVEIDSLHEWMRLTLVGGAALVLSAAVTPDR